MALLGEKSVIANLSDQYLFGVSLHSRDSLVNPSNISLGQENTADNISFIADANANFTNPCLDSNMPKSNFVAPRVSAFYEVRQICRRCLSRRLVLHIVQLSFYLFVLSINKTLCHFSLLVQSVLNTLAIFRG